MSPSGNSEEFLGSPEGPLEVCGYNFKVKLLSIWYAPLIKKKVHISSKMVPVAMSSVQKHTDRVAEKSLLPLETQGLMGAIKVCS